MSEPNSLEVKRNVEKQGNPPKKKIGYLINQYPKISHTFIRREILELENQGVTVFRYAMRGYNGKFVDQADERERNRTRYLLKNGIAKLAISLLRMVVHRPKRFLAALHATVKLGTRAERSFPFHLLYLAEACRLALWMTEDNISHLHAHFGTNSAEVALLASVLSNVPYSFTVHGPEEFDKPGPLHLAEKVRNAAFVVAVSSFGRSQLYRTVSYRYWNKIHVVRCALETSAFCSIGKAPSRANRIVCVGRLCEQKGQLLLVDAARKLADRGFDFELVFAGDGEMRSEIEERVRLQQLENVVRITGWINAEQIRNEIENARAFVLPSFAEGLPVALMEAMALGCPVLTTWVAGIPELVTHQKSGWLFPPGDVDSLVTALIEMLSAPMERLRQMGQTGRSAVHARHEISTEVKKLLTHILFKNDR